MPRHQSMAEGPVDLQQIEARELAALESFVDFLSQPDAENERRHFGAMIKGSSRPDGNCGLCYSLRQGLVRAAAVLGRATDTPTLAGELNGQVSQEAGRG